LVITPSRELHPPGGVPERRWILKLGILIIIII
jgi:hypothetical protein